MSRTVNEALKIALSKVRPLNRKGFIDGGDVSTGEPRTVPEKPETIRMQLRQLANGKRAGVFVARGTKGVTLPEGMRVVRTQEGNIIFDPTVISKEEIETAVQSGRLNELLGYVQSKPEALAQSLELGELPNLVVSRDKNGVEQDSAAVSPDRAEEQAEVFEDRARGGSTVSVEPLHDGVLRDRMAEGGVPDEESQEKFLKEQLEGSLPQEDKEAGLKTLKEAGLMAAGFVPGSGVAAAAGKFPTAEGGFEPSAKEDWRAGRYGSAALKAAGAAGDVLSAIPVAGTAAGALLKAPLAAKLAMAAAPMAKVAKEAAPAVKAAEETVEAAKPAYQRLVNPAGFYSRAHEAAMTELPEGERTWQEMHSLLSKAPRVQKEELHWSGIHPETFDPKQKVTREQIGEMIEKNFPKVAPVIKGGAPQPHEVNAELEILRKHGFDPQFTELPDGGRKWLIQDTEEGGHYSAQELSKLKDVPEEVGKAAQSLERATPMHETYTVPGGENYNERILTHEYRPGEERAPEITAKYKDELEDLLKRNGELQSGIEQAVQRHNAEVVNPYYQELKADADKMGINASRMTPAELARALGKEDEYANIARSPEAQRLGEERLGVSEQITALRSKMAEESKELTGGPDYTRNQFRHTQHLGDINNPILHTRNSERNIPGRGKVWHQEEVQSDWAQQGRERGFQGPALSAKEQTELNTLYPKHIDSITNPDAWHQELESIAKATESGDSSALRKATNDQLQYLADNNFGYSGVSMNTHAKAAYNELERRGAPNKPDLLDAIDDGTYFKSPRTESPISEAEKTKLETLNKKIEGSKGGMPAAPHVRDTEHWLDLAAKDTLKNAIEGGHDHIFITGGQEQAKRWENELRKAVDNVRWETPNAEKTQQAIEAATKQRAVVRDQFSDTVFGKPYSELTETAQQNIDKMMRQAGKDVTIPEAVKSGASAGVKDQYANYFHNKSYAELTPQQRATVDKELIASGHGPEDSKIVYAKPVGSDAEHRFVVKQVEGSNGKPRVEVVDSSIPSAKGETLSAVVGGDLAKRIMAEESGEQAMKGYRMGSEGYSQTYERKYPSSFKKLLKSLDPEAKIEAGALESKAAQYKGPEIDQDEFMVTINSLPAELDNDAELMLQIQNVGQKIEDGIPVSEAIGSSNANRVAEILGGSLTEAPEGVHGTWIPITPKMRAEYNRLKQKHGAVFPAYERGGTVDAKSNSRYTGADRRLLERALHLTRKLTE